MAEEPSVRDVRAIHMRRRALLVYGGFVLALVPWTAYLTGSLPSEHHTTHWDVLWGGFDVGLILAGLATAVAVLRGLRVLPICASITGTLLLCDAWFDLLTSGPGSDRMWAIGEALLAEIPLAFFSFWVAVDAGTLEAAAQRSLGAIRARRTTP